MKTCPVCGKQCEDKARFCNECGSRFPAADPVEEPAWQRPAEPAVPAPDYDIRPEQNAAEPAGAAPVYEEPVWQRPAEPAAPAARTVKEFLKLPENKKLRANLRASGIICYLSAALTLGLTIPTGYIDITVIIAVLLVVGLGLLIHLKQSRVAAIILLAYSLINMIYSLVTAGTPNGYLIVLAGVYAVLSTFKLDKLWKKYKAERGI